MPAVHTVYSVDSSSVTYRYPRRQAEGSSEAHWYQRMYVGTNVDMRILQTARRGSAETTITNRKLIICAVETFGYLLRKRYPCGALG